MLTFKSLRMLACTVALCLSGLVATAQTRDFTRDFSSFNAVFVDNDFAVTFEKSARDYSVSLNVDSALKNYVKTYVKNRKLYIELDQKAIPSDVKKQYKGKSSPLLNVTVYAPEFITDIEMAGASTLTVNEEVECTDFTLTLRESAYVQKLIVDATNLTVNTENKASGFLTLYADNLTLNTAGTSSLEVDTDSELVTVNAAGSSNVDLSGNAVTTILNTSGSSKTRLEGQTVDLDITGGNSSNVDAINFKTANATVILSQWCKVTEAATETLTVDLSGSSSLVFDCDPVIKVVNIKSSSMSRYENIK